MKKKKKKNKPAEKVLKCICCKNEVYGSEVEEMKKIKIPYGANYTIKVDNDFLKTYKNSILNDKNFQWACDSCLASKRAIKGNPANQTYCDYSPYLAYFDRDFECESCESTFVFAKKEQKFWYEELKFWVQSMPKHCKSCRKEIRKEKQYHKRIAELNEKQGSLKIDELSELAVIYDHFGNEQKRNKYLNLVKKKSLEKKPT